MDARTIIAIINDALAVLIAVSGGVAAGAHFGMWSVRRVTHARHARRNFIAGLVCAGIASTYLLLLIQDISDLHIDAPRLPAYFVRALIVLMMCVIWQLRERP